ncbi:hypothetical protein KY290_011397 [Solanum tuberosum]|uniref:Uncharacterized protein n=1 Tax=Solanum tuberosum TaxID=4113 RepID=A0ABQ7W0Y9_SOLTU|nr:hypothetical protein KY285_011444 [Solanum tuberosum]KAH0774260.1 hypothetical protein KY290_011397 [Solanum tuberosum]
MIWVITDLGERLAVLPLSPEIGNLLLTSSGYNCILDVLIICSMMAGLFTNPQNNLLKDICDYLDLKLPELWRPGKKYVGNVANTVLQCPEDFGLEGYNWFEMTSIAIHPTVPHMM